MLLQAASVLVVDDRPASLVPLVRALSDEGAHVAIAPNAREAFNLCRRRPFDIVITNGELRDASVDVFVRAVRAVDGAAFIVVNDGSGQLSKKSHEIGADLIVSDHTDPASVVALLRNSAIRRAA